MQDQEKDLLNNFIEHAEDYLKTRQEYSKLLAVEKGSKALSAGITTLILFCIFLCFFIFISLAIAYLISEYTGKISTGFGIVGAFYLLAGIILYIGRERLLKIPIMNIIISNIFQEKEDEED